MVFPSHCSPKIPIASALVEGSKWMNFCSGVLLLRVAEAATVDDLLPEMGILAIVTIFRPPHRSLIKKTNAPSGARRPIVAEPASARHLLPKRGDIVGDLEFVTLPSPPHLTGMTPKRFVPNFETMA